MSSFFEQLKQRRVYRVAIGYAIVAWLMVQIAATVLPAFHAPEFVLPVLIVLLGIGFPVALVLAWAFDVTPEGIEKTHKGTGTTAAKNMHYAWALAGLGLLVAAGGVGASPCRKVHLSPRTQLSPSGKLPLLPEPRFRREASQFFHLKT